MYKYLRFESLRRQNLRIGNWNSKKTVVEKRSYYSLSGISLTILSYSINYPIDMSQIWA